MINLTQHQATKEQLNAGVLDLPEADREVLKNYLTFDEQPTAHQIWVAAIKITQLAFDHGATEAMIGGAPYLMAPLEDMLLENGIEPVYAFSKRVSAEVTLPDGSVRKVNTFVHKGFIRPHKEKFD